MKTCTVFAAAAFVAALSLDSASAMKSYLKNLPNGDAAFTQSLGHVSDSDTGLNDFGKLYSAKGGKWADMCKEKFPGTDMTVGAAFGDPCCKWTSGAADQKVDPFVKPTKATVCAANAPASSAPASSAPAPAASTPAPAATTAAPGGGKPAPAPVPTTIAPAGNSTATPPSGKPDAGKPDGGKPGKPSKCGVKPDAKKENKSLEDDSDDNDVNGDDDNDDN